MHNYYYFNTHIYKTQSSVTYIQTDYRDQLIKVEPADSEFCTIHLKKTGVSTRHYTIVPDVPEGPSQMLADNNHSNGCVFSNYNYHYFCHLIVIACILLDLSQRFKTI